MKVKCRIGPIFGNNRYQEALGSSWIVGMERLAFEADIIEHV